MNYNLSKLKQKQTIVIEIIKLNSKTTRKSRIILILNANSNTFKMSNLNLSIVLLYFEKIYKQQIKMITYCFFMIDQNLHAIQIKSNMKIVLQQFNTFFVKQ